MFNRNTSIPSWLGPIIGTVLGVFVAVKSGRVNGTTEAPVFELLVGAGVGFAAGSILWLVDRKPAKRGNPPKNAGSPISRAIAVIQILLFWLPLLGAIVSISGLVLNWKVRGWPKTLCWLGAGLSVVFTLPLVAILFVSKGP